MAVKSGFFNSINGDRKYDANWFAEYFSSFIINGVFPEPITSMQVVANDNLTTTIRAGRGWINGYFVMNDSDFIITHDQSDGVLDRIDRVVIRLNYLTRQIELICKKGVFSSSPVAQELERNADYYELALADVYITKGQTQISQTNITDLRTNSYLCGWASARIVGWETIKEQFYEWFDKVQSESYATSEELSESTRLLKKELANLNLQLEANKRVKNGTTFGTNFDTTFNMEIDYTKTFSENSLEVGATSFVVNDYAGFKVGQEVTIYDDVNLERTKILNINSYTFTVAPLKNSYKQGVNIARTMAIEDTIHKHMEFGSWGKIETKTIPLASVSYSNRRNDNVKGQYRIAIIDDDIFLINGTFTESNSSWGASVLKYSNGVWNYFKNLSIGASAGKENVQILVIDNLLWCFEVGSLNIYDKNGTVIKTAQSINYTKQQILFNEREKIFYLWSEGTVYKYSYNEQYTVTLLSTQTPFSSSQAGTNVIFLENEKLFVARVYNNILTIDTNDSSFGTSLGSGWSSNPITLPTNFYRLVSVFKANDKLHLVYLKYVNNECSLCEIISSNNGLTWGSEVVLKVVRTGTISYLNNNHTFKDINKNIFIAINLQLTNYFFKFNIKTDDWEVLDGWVGELNSSQAGSTASVGVMFSENITLKKPIAAFYNYVASNDIYINGEYLVGTGTPITTNDIRFTTKKTNELATWIEHDVDLTISEAMLNDRQLELDTVETETQLLGTKFDNEIAEVRFTINRQSTDDDLKITHIIGGVN